MSTFKRNVISFRSSVVRHFITTLVPLVALASTSEISLAQDKARHCVETRDCEKPKICNVQKWTCETPPSADVLPSIEPLPSIPSVEPLVPSPKAQKPTKSKVNEPKIKIKAGKPRVTSKPPVNLNDLDISNDPAPVPKEVPAQPNLDEGAPALKPLTSPAVVPVDASSNSTSNKNADVKVSKSQPHSVVPLQFNASAFQLLVSGLSSRTVNDEISYTSAYGANFRIPIVSEGSSGLFANVAVVSSQFGTTFPSDSLRYLKERGSNNSYGVGLGVAEGIGKTRFFIAGSALYSDFEQKDSLTRGSNYDSPFTSSGTIRRISYAANGGLYYPNIFNLVVTATDVRFAPSSVDGKFMLPFSIAGSSTLVKTTVSTWDSKGQDPVYAYGSNTSRVIRGNADVYAPVREFSKNFVLSVLLVGDAWLPDTSAKQVLTGGAGLSFELFKSFQLGGAYIFSEKSPVMLTLSLDLQRLLEVEVSGRSDGVREHQSDIRVGYTPQ
ncbi:MAG: hypothetical protein Q7S22_09010 [Candidatus Micrarchaeota archaeon]|nr:hypothetical protein [Candidatus Micrarchaeota archaeon]